MNARTILRAALVALAAAAVSACAVLTVDVDVYKGPLINSEKMKVEQVVAMSVAAKPMLLQLRSIFEKGCADYAYYKTKGGNFSAQDTEGPGSVDCLLVENPDKLVVRTASAGRCANINDSVVAVPEGCLASWQARRVNAILFLYQDAGIGGDRLQGFGERIVQLEQSLRELRRAIIAVGKTMNLPGQGQADPNSSIAAYRQLQDDMMTKKLDELPQADREAVVRMQRQENFRSADDWRRGRAQFAKYFLSGPEAAAALENLRLNARSTWWDAMSFLADAGLRNDLSGDPSAVLDWVADLATDITDPTELIGFLLGPNANAWAPNLADAAKSEPSLRALPSFTEESLRNITAALRRLLVGKRGQSIALELLRVQSRLVSSEVPAGLASQIDPGNLEQRLAELKERKDAIVLTGLQKGRREKGIERLAQNYMSMTTISEDELSQLKGQDWTAASVKTYKTQLEAEYRAQRELQKRIRRELLNSLTDFGQKVAHMANLQPLLPNVGDDKGRRIQLLQTIGNSILNQIDDFKKLDEFNDRMRNTAKAEVAALGRARAALSGATISLLLQEIADSKLELSKKTEIAQALREGSAKLKEASGLLQTELDQAGKTTAGKKADLDRWSRARKALVDADLTANVDKAASGAADDAKFTEAACTALAAYADSRAAEEAKKNAGGRAAEYQAVKAAFGELRKVALKKGTSAAEVAKAWTARADQAIADADAGFKTSAAKEATLKNWLGRVETSIAANLGGPDDAADAESALDAFDNVLRELEYQRVLATRAGLENTVHLIDGALTYARERRASMMYLRPASLYLRDSYPATVLQQSPADSGAVPNLIWRKLSSAFIKETPGEDLTVRNTVDKQFWQTINQIRLGGGGNTNYVVTKDDLGNWYVKSYTNEIGMIADSVRNLALFNFGSRIQSNLLAATPPAKAGSATQGAQAAQAAAPAGAAERSILGKQFDKANQDYRTQLLTTLQAARKAALALPDATYASTTAQLGADSRNYLAAKKDAIFKSPDGTEFKFSVGASGDADKNADKLNTELNELLGNMLDYYTKARDALRREADQAAQDKAAGKDVAQLSEADRKTATLAMWKIVRKAIDDRIAEADNAGAKFEGRLTFIDDLARPDAAQAGK